MTHRIGRRSPTPQPSAISGGRLRLALLVSLLALLTLAQLSACSPGGRKHKIGISQCSEDIWRDKQNAELRMDAFFHDDVELLFTVAHDSDTRQVQQIDSLVEAGIDLLIVAPNQMATISPAIDRAYDKGIPVIVFERKTNSQKYTAFMGADNYEMGQLMGEYIASQLKGSGRVLEMMGLKGSSPAIERHKGFTDALRPHEGIELVQTLQGDWTEQSAYRAVMDYDGDLTNLSFVFGQNDRMAIGVRKALADKGVLTKQTRFCGIDGLAGENGGIRLVRDSVLAATYIYPTHGDQLLELAVNILEGKPYKKENPLMSALVTHENAHVLLMQNEEIVRQSEYLDRLHAKSDDYLNRLNMQRVITFFAIGFIVLLLMVIAGAWHYLLQRARMREEREQMTRERLDFYTHVSHELRTPLTLIEGPLSQLAVTDEMQKAQPGTAQLLDIVRRNAQSLSELVNKILAAQAEKHPMDLLVMTDEEHETKVPLPQNHDDPETNTETRTLLIVDDNADIRTYLRSILQPHYQLLEAANGQQGLELARKEVPDLIISDVMMPVMNGLEFCQKVKEDFVTSHIPVILLTARALSRHLVEGYRCGADAYITKPFAADVLTARIENLLKSRQVLKDLWTPVTPTATAPPTPAPHEQAPEAPAPQETAVISPAGQLFLDRFKAIIDQHLTDSDLSVETIGQEMGLSRVQLYRKVKALTGCSPVDLLRRARLAEARQLLLNSGLSVSEIAYQVGFSSPSYFTKCFKDEFGMVPGEVRAK